MIGAQPSGSADPSHSASPSPTQSATAPASTSPAPTDSPKPSTPAKDSLDGRQFVSVLVTENGTSKVLVPGTKIRLGLLAIEESDLSRIRGENEVVAVD